MAELFPIEDKFVSVFNAPEGGIAFFAPKGTVAPTTFTKPSALGAAFESLGDLGEDGFTETTDSDSNDFKNVSGNTVLTVSKGKSRSFKLTLIETERPSVQSLSVGPVEKNEDGTIKSVDLTTKDSDEGVLVVYELLSSGTLRMYVLDRAKPVSFDDVKHNNGDLISHVVGLNCMDNGKKSVGRVLYGTAV